MLILWISYFINDSSIIMSRCSLHMGIHWRLLDFRLYCILIHNLLVKRRFRCWVFLIRSLIVCNYWFISLIRSPYQQTLDLVIVLFVPEDFPHNLILVAVWNFILSLTSTSIDSWVRLFPCFSAIHEHRIILFAWWLRLLIVFRVSTSSHLIYNAETFLSKLWMVFRSSSRLSSSWSLRLLLPLLNIIVRRARRKSRLLEIPCQQNRLVITCLITQTFMISATWRT